MNHFLLTTLLTSILIGCSPATQIIKYPQRNDDTFVNYNLKKFLADHKTIKIVLRVPNSSDKATSNTIVNKNADLLYNAIEKEFLRQGFSVRDRGLFNEIIDKAGSSDYSKIQGLTDTDLILEVVNIDDHVLYSTNKLTLVKRNEETEKIQEIDYKRYGAAVEFKLILVKQNEIAGSYKFNYRPCATGCQLNNFVIVKKQVQLRETISVNEMEEFITDATRKLITNLRAD
jgi:hypothetical protein